MKQIALFLVVFMAATPGCRAHTTSAETEVRSALNVLAGVVDPAYEFAVDACIARQSQIADAVEHKELSPFDGDAMIASVRQRCAKMRATFDLIRRSHTEAAALVEAGKVTEAQRQIDAALEAWRSLKGE